MNYYNALTAYENKCHYSPSEKLFYFSLSGVIDDLPSDCILVNAAEAEALSKEILLEQETTEKKLEETEWSKSQLTKTSTAIVHYESDAQIPEIYSELRVTNYTEDDYYALLGDRKLLVEYVEQDDFPECGRPTLSGLVK